MLVRGKNIYVFFFCSVVLLFCLFKNPFSFNYEIKPDGCYLLLSISLVSLLVICLSGGNSNSCIGILVLSALFLLNPPLLAVEHLIVVFSMMTVYYGVRSGPGIIEWVLNALLTGWLIELFISMMQSLPDGSALALGITGTMHNSGILACYLVVHIPLLFFSLFQRTTGLLRLPLLLRLVIFLFLTACVSFIVDKTGSRTAFIALVVTLCLIVYLNNASAIGGFLRQLPKIVLWMGFVLSILVIAGLAVWLFFLKEPSAMGRAMMAIITLEHFGEHFWIGIGPGRFTWFYPQWQSLYFEQHRNVNIRYLLTADESYLAFNEYLQLFKEMGLLGGGIFGIGLYYFFTSRSDPKDRSLLNAARITVISILSCGFTSYPFHVSVLLFLLAICFAIVATIRVSTISPTGTRLQLIRRLPGPVSGIVTVLAAWLSFFSIRLLMAERKWEGLSENFVISRQAAKDEYASIYTTLRYDGKFLTEYGEFLAQDSSDCLDAIRILEEAKKYFISERTVLAIGMANKQVGDYCKSIEAFKWLANYLPNRFFLKYELFKLYRESGDIANVRLVGHAILAMPVKFPSPEIARIKYETRRLLDQLQ